MLLSEVLAVDRILIDKQGLRVQDKWSALSVLSKLLEVPVQMGAEAIEKCLVEREKLQSTGIGSSVAIPHASHDDVRTPSAALLLSARGIQFDAIDGEPVSIVLSVIGPKKAAGEHLKTLAHISRLLRSASVRSRLVRAETSAAAFDIIKAECAE